MQLLILMCWLSESEGIGTEPERIFKGLFSLSSSALPSSQALGPDGFIEEFFVFFQDLIGKIPISTLKYLLKR